MQALDHGTLLLMLRPPATSCLSTVDWLGITDGWDDMSGWLAAVADFGLWLFVVRVLVWRPFRQEYLVVALCRRMNLESDT